MTGVAELLLIRHGQSSYNLQNRFTGCIDVPLSQHGIEEAKADAVKLQQFNIDAAFTSTLKRAIDTLNIILNARQGNPIAAVQNSALNERNYGELQGLNKADVIKQYGEEQVNLWRRGYTDTPPGGESLQDTEARVMPYFNQQIGTQLKLKRNVLIVAHGNSLRAIVKNLNKISDQEVINLNIATGSMYWYQLDANLAVTEQRILTP